MIQKLLSSFYTDNCVMSVKCKSDLNTFITVSTEIVVKENFELRRWEHTDLNALYSAKRRMGIRCLTVYV